MSKQQGISDELLINYLLNETNKDEEAIVFYWINESEANRSYYEQFVSVWELSKSLDSTIEVDNELAWQKLKLKLNKKKSNVFELYKKPLSIAASIALVIGIIYLLQPKPVYIKPIANTNNTKSEVPQAPKVVDTPSITKATPQSIAAILSNKKILTETLDDKSVITLNKNTQLNAPDKFAEKERRVQLKGEAFFAITPNKAKPFVVETQNNVEITVLGTSFNVKSYKEFTEVIVESGLVQVRYHAKAVLLRPNESARIDKGDSTIVIQKINNKLYKYYRNKIFECEETPLWKFVEVLNEAYGDSVRIENNNLKNLKLTTSFNNESLSNILEILSETFDFEVVRSSNKYLLK
jgi:transmembrane sensor